MTGVGQLYWFVLIGTMIRNCSAKHYLARRKYLRQLWFLIHPIKNLYLEIFQVGNTKPDGVSISRPNKLLPRLKYQWSAFTVIVCKLLYHSNKQCIFPRVARRANNRPTTASMHTQRFIYCQPVSGFIFQLYSNFCFLWVL